MAHLTPMALIPDRVCWRCANWMCTEPGKGQCIVLPPVPLILKNQVVTRYPEPGPYDKCLSFRLNTRADAMKKERLGPAARNGDVEK